MALDCGISPERFWNLSIGEIRDLLESFERRERRELKMRLQEKHFLAQDISQYVSLVINGSRNTEIKELWDYFPELFGEERPAAESREKEQKMAVYKAQMVDFANRHNYARSGGGIVGRHDA